MRRTVFLSLALLALLLASLLGSQAAVSLRRAEISNIYVKVFRGQDTYILSFTAGNPNPNIVFTSKYLPTALDPRSVFITANGQWIFARTLAKPNPDLYYGRVGEPLTRVIENAIWSSTSADGQYLFYISIDAEGRNETFNLLKLATSQRIEWTAAALPANPPGQQYVLNNLTENALPAVGWTLSGDRIVLTSYVRFPGRTYQVNGFYSLDLSGVDFARAGSLPLPPRIAISRLAQSTSEAYISPDGTKLAYLYEDGEYRPANSMLAVMDLMTGQTHTMTEDGSIFAITWAANSKALFYLTGSGIRQYELASAETRPHPTDWMERQNYSGTFILCGDSFFYQTDALYDISVTEFIPDRLYDQEVSILSCAPVNAWQEERATGCDAYCADAQSAPAVGETVNIATLGLTGGNAARGSDLYIYHGCPSCHNSVYAPAAQGTYTRVVNERLKDPANVGKSVEQYLAESIIYPGLYIAPKYANLMPSIYGNMLSMQDLKDLIAYLMTQK